MNKVSPSFHALARATYSTYKEKKGIPKRNFFLLSAAKNSFENVKRKAVSIITK
jgi:hypothetical protein